MPVARSTMLVRNSLFGAELGFALGLCMLLAAFVGPEPAVAQTGETLQLMDLRHELAPGLRFGSKIEVDVEWDKNFDLDRSRKNDEGTIEPQYKLGVAYQPSPFLFFFGELELLRTYFFDKPPDKDLEDFELQVDQLYVQIDRPELGLVVRTGRESYKDELEWLYDEDLDGIRTFFDLGGPFHLELHANREELFFPKNILDTRTDDKINNYMARMRYDVAKRTHVDGFVYARDDVGRRPEDKLFFGTQTIGRVNDVIVKDDQVRFWSNAAIVTGDDNGTDFSGFGFDAYGTYVFSRPLNPSVTLGIAFGSGDKNPDDGTDHNFRQTDLQDNDGKFNSVSRFKYYGEVFDPELSNMVITTIGIGLRPVENFSIDLVYHKYWQQHATDEIRDSNLDIDPNGLSRDLGQELDLILGYEASKDLELKLTFGAFLPGSAFDSNADPAAIAVFEIEYKF